MQPLGSKSLQPATESTYTPSAIHAHRASVDQLLNLTNILSASYSRRSDSGQTRMDVDATGGYAEEAFEDIEEETVDLGQKLAPLSKEQVYIYIYIYIYICSA